MNKRKKERDRGGERVSGRERGKRVSQATRKEAIPDQVDQEAASPSSPGRPGRGEKVARLHKLCVSGPPVFVIKLNSRVIILTINIHLKCSKYSLLYRKY